MVKAHRHFMMPWSLQTAHSPPVFVGGHGCYLHDESGKRYFDFSSGWMCSNLGHQNEAINAAISRQLEKLCYAPPYLTTDIRAQFAQRLCNLVDLEGPTRVHFTTGGGDANDDACRIARQVTGRTKTLAAYRSFHGDTTGSAALTGGQRRWGAEPVVPPGVVRFFAPMPYRSPFHTEDPQEEVERALDHLQRIISHEGATSIASIIIEPVLGSDGLVVYPDGYLEGLAAIARSHGILVIHDEVMVGFGRTGEMFATQRLKLDPDMITFAKGVTGAYVPLGGVLISEHVASFYDERPFSAGHTYSGHPLAMAAGMGALDAFEKGQHFSSAYHIETWLRAGLEAIQSRHPIVGDLRGIGAFFAIELVKDRNTKESFAPLQGPIPPAMRIFQEELLAHGLWLYSKHNLLIFAPPLISTKFEISESLAAFESVLQEHEMNLLTSKP
ncbi:aminotransferase class III-fold pyridoxal phosphate-dependent enzyme [Ruegeria arenilitoris]|uniref:aminotransferase class III-fold pyridoxal phosphate-dependent enzyme n=1 Tax=Ruegeria arenilitoris TaxID=1173585 RepID=UPI001C2C8FE9|nr:aminotransferase class III-fold pyridoxal phosphate-dependent enzyme [Ruegeria arenilitoris]